MYKFYRELSQKSKYLFPEEYESIFPEAMRARLNSGGIENREVSNQDLSRRQR
jgi:hypothetical protein